MLIRYIIAVIVLAFSTLAFGQSQIPFYKLNRTVGQANQLNPALFPEHRVIIGFPGLSSIYASANADRLSFNEIFTRRADDSLQFDSTNFVNILKDINRIETNVDLNLFYLGLRIKRNYFSLAVNSRINGALTFPKDAIEWALFGPADPRNANRAFTLDGFSGKATAFHEVALGYGRRITDRLYIGGRLKLLYGVANLTTDNLNGRFLSRIDSVFISNDAFTINTAGFSDLFDSNISSSDFLKNNVLNFGNRGTAFDIGAKYRVNDLITLTASATDIGSIKWKDFTKSYGVNAVTYSYSGFDVLDLLNNDQNISNEFVQQELDSLERLYELVETEGITYSSALIPRVYMGANIELLNMHNFGATAYSDFFEGDINTAFALSYGFKFRRLLNTVVTATYKNGSLGNIGGGLSLRLGVVQLYAASENILSALYPARAKRANVRFGMNLTFGQVKDRDPRRRSARQDDDFEQEPEEQIEEQIEEIPQDTTQVEPPPVVEEPEPEPEPEPELEPQPVPQPDTVQVAPVDTVRIEPVVPIDTTTTQPDTLVVEQQIPQDTVQVVEPPIDDEPPVVVKRGNHPLELDLGHYVVVGSFSIEENAKRYSDQLINSGFDNSYGYSSEKGYYYVTVFYDSDSMDAVRIERNKYRQIQQFLFPDAWLLTVEE